MVFLNNFKLRFFIYEFSKGENRKLESEEIAFTEETVQDGFIRDNGAFAAKVSEFLAAKPEWRKLRVLFLISEEKVFLKGFELDLGDLERKEELKRNFITEIPFLEEELIIKESLSGKVLELAAISKKFLEDLQKPFSDLNFAIAGVIAIPQALAFDLAPKEKTILMAFYDNDLILVLSENSRVLFSETEQLRSKDLAKNAVSALDYFKKHPYAKDINSVVLVLDPDLPETLLSEKLKEEKYIIISVAKTNIFDLAAGYFQKNEQLRKNWDLLHVEKGGKQKYFIYSGIALLVLGLISGGFLFYQKMFLPKISDGGVQLSPEISATTSPIVPVMPESAPAAVPEPPEKENFPIRIFNGTRIAGEAGRLRAILQEKGFTVINIGNNEDQNQIATAIFASGGIPEELVSELRLILALYYQEVLVSPSPVSDNKVINIVIGKKK